MPHMKMKMQCSEAEKWISARVDGVDLPAVAAAALDEHLSVCGACSRVSALESRRAALLSAALRLDEGLQFELSRSILSRAASAGAPDSTPVTRPAAFLGSRMRWGIAAAFLLAAGTWLLVGRREPPGPESPGGAGGGDYSLSIMLEDEIHSLDPFPAAGGPGAGLETRKTRKILVDSPGGARSRLETGGGLGGNLRIEEERVDSRLIRPAGLIYN